MEGLFIKVKSSKFGSKLKEVYDRAPSAWVFITGKDVPASDIVLKGTPSEKVHLVAAFRDDEDEIDVRFEVTGIPSEVEIPAEVHFWEIE